MNAKPSGSPQENGETVQSLLSAAKRVLAESGNPTPGLDARLLLQQAAELSHEALIADPTRPISADAVAMFREFLDRRRAGEPVSRIQGEREFYGRPFKITAATLDPRADTETLIEAALASLSAGRSYRIIDLGCGSGIIGVTLLAERPEVEVLMTDISAEALAVARENAEHYGVLARSAFLHGNWFEGVEGRFDLVLSNPPYIPQAIFPTLAPEVRNFDPETALKGGPDGLQAYREIARMAVPFLVPRGHVIVEIGVGQEIEIKEIFSDHGWLAEGVWRDLAGHVRCLGFSRSGPRQKRGWK